MRETRTPETETTFRSNHLQIQSSLFGTRLRRFASKNVVTGGSGVKESDLLPEHGLEDGRLHGGVDEAHGDVVHKVAHKLKNGTANTQRIT